MYITQKESDLKDYLDAVGRVEKPIVSIVVPVYQDMTYLHRFLSDMKAQETLIPYEIIFVNNNDTEGTIFKLRTMGATIVQEQKQGVNHARELGRITARGSIILSMDMDTSYPVNYIDMMALPMLINENISLTYCTSIGCQDVTRPSILIRLKGWVKVLKNITCRKPLCRIKSVRAHAAAFRAYDMSAYPTDLTNVSGCDDGYMALRMYCMGNLHLVKSLIYTTRGSQKRIGKALFPKY